MALHDNLKDARNRMGMSQELVAEQLGVSRQAVTKWELGQSKPSARNLKALADLYQIPSEELLNTAKREGPNLILRANSIKWAIICQTAFLCSTAHFAYMLRSTYMLHSNDPVYQWSFTVSLVALLLCSTWATTNHRFEQDKNQRRKNINIELGYCVIQLLLSLLTIYSGRGLVGVTLILLVEIVYLLYINPKYMNRKLTK